MNIWKTCYKHKNDSLKSLKYLGRTTWNGSCSSEHKTIPYGSQTQKTEQRTTSTQRHSSFDTYRTPNPEKGISQYLPSLIVGSQQSIQMPTCLSTPTCTYTYRLPLVSFEWPSWSWIVYQGHGKTCPGHALSANGAIIECYEAHCFIVCVFIYHCCM